MMNMLTCSSSLRFGSCCFLGVIEYHLVINQLLVSFYAMLVSFRVLFGSMLSPSKSPYLNLSSVC